MVYDPEIGIFLHVQWIKHFGLCAKEQNESMRISKQWTASYWCNLALRPIQNIKSQKFNLMRENVNRVTDQ